METGFPDLVDLLINVGRVVPPLIMMLQAVVAVMGLWLVSSGLIEIWGVTHDNALKYVAGRERYSVSSALVSLFIGSLLLSMATLELVGIMSRTLTGDYVDSRMPQALSYGGGGISEKTEIATLALLGIMQIVGFIAMVKGWMTVNGYFNQSARAGLGTATGWIVGGVLAWNFKWFSDLINNSIGFNIIGMFTPFTN